MVAAFAAGRLSADEPASTPPVRMQDSGEHADHDSMAMMAEVESEAQFLAQMIPHHQEAIDTAKVLLDGTEREEMREFARGIISSQQAEADDMTGWLEQWHPDEPEFSDYEPMMDPDLADMTGDELDQTFIEGMLEHHMMAVHMSRMLLEGDLDEHAEVTELATNIRDNQTREILQMHDWLDEWFDVQVPHGGMLHGMGE